MGFQVSGVSRGVSSQPQTPIFGIFLINREPIFYHDFLDSGFHQNDAHLPCYNRNLTPET